MNAEAQTEAIMAALPGLMAGDKEEATAAAEAIADTIESGAGYMGAAIGLAVSAAVFAKKVLPSDGDGTYSIEQVEAHAEDDPELNATRALVAMCNDDRDMAFAICLAMYEHSPETAAEFFAALVTTARDMYQLAKREGVLS